MLLLDGNLESLPYSTCPREIGLEYTVPFLLISWKIMLASLQSTIGALLLACQVATQDVSFSLYPTVDPAHLAQAFNISEDCLEAL